MVVRLAVVRGGEQDVHSLAARSRAALDAPLAEPAELVVSIASGDGVLLGAFQRLAGLGLPELGAVCRRGSGGPEVRVAAGSVHVLLSLATPAALVDSDAKRIVNRHVRPLLRALTRTGHLAHHFGRDWVSVGGRPVAWVGFAHDASSHRTAFEALVAVGAPYAVLPRESLRGRQAAVVGVDPERLVAAIVDAYAHGVEPVEKAYVTRDDDGGDGGVAAGDPPWAARRSEVIGTLGAGRDAAGVFRIGGDLLVSRDALARLEAAVVAPGADVGGVIDETLGAAGVALDGVRAMGSVRACVEEALRAPRDPD